MTKKSKKKALKTGYRTPDDPRSTTVNVDCTLQKVQHKRSSTDHDDDEEYFQTKHLSKAERKRLDMLKQKEILELYKKENNTRAVYPIDLWFLIGQFIPPELVKRFSMICKGSYHVTCSRKFWLDLYKKCVTEHKNLPSHLKPKAIDTNIGLRARVVRSLFFVYKPFNNKVLHHVPLAESPSILEDLMVESHWWKRLVSVKQHIYVWRLYFKLVKVNSEQNVGKSIYSVTRLIEHNTEEKYKLLQVTSSSFVNVPNVLFGMCLTEVSVSVSRDMKSHKVKLFFHEYRKYRRYHNSQATILVVDPVLDVQILNWWDPEYPHPLDT